MLSDTLIDQLTSRLTLARTGETYTVVRPGLGLAIYYRHPLAEIAPTLERALQSYLDFVPKGSITALGGANAWGDFTPARMARQLKQLRSPSVEYTNIDLGSGPLRASEGPYGWHFDGSSLTDAALWPDDANVCFHEFPHDELQRVGVERMIEWVVGIAELAPFESAQFGYSFNQLQRTWTAEADEFVGRVAMRFRGFDILEPRLARVARGRVPNCSWLTLLGTPVVDALGGEGAVRAALSSDVAVTPLRGGLLLRAGESPAIGDSNRQAADLGPVKEVARLTKPLRSTKRVLFYGSDDFRHHWVDRLDD